VDEARLYEVNERGTAVTAREDPGRAAARHGRLRWLLGLAIAANAVSWSLAGVALWLGGRVWGAGFGLLAVLSLPLLALPALVEALARLRARRRHRTRPEDFPPA
jgi:Flp pilus assembly protein TadB